MACFAKPLQESVLAYYQFYSQNALICRRFELSFDYVIFHFVDWCNFSDWLLRCFLQIVLRWMSMNLLMANHQLSIWIWLTATWTNVYPYVCRDIAKYIQFYLGKPIPYPLTRWRPFWSDLNAIPYYPIFNFWMTRAQIARFMLTLYWPH